MANSSFFKNDGVTTSLQTNLTDKAADAEKLAINPEDDQFTLSDGTTTGYSALHHKEKAIDAQTAAEAAETAAETAKTAAETAKTGAETAKTAAETAKTGAETAQTAAETAETNAETAETNASTSATNAATSETNAATSATTASTKAAEASTSATNAATSETNAETAKTAAENAKTAAETAKTAAENAKTAAETAETNAETAESNASTSETNAANSATSAATSATTAATKASEASTSATNAATSATTASTKASEASTSAAAAAASQTAAAASAASAASTYDQFDDRYLGTKSSDPTVDNDGNALVEGALYFSSTDNAMQVYDGSEWIAASAAGSVSITEYHYTATANQTAFSGSGLSYTVDNLVVIMNGVILQNGSSKDFTATDGSTVTLTSGAAAGDEIHIIVFKSFTTADMVSKTNGGAYSGSVDFTGGLEINGTAVTATAAELNTLDGITSSTAELNLLDGVTATTAELNYVDGVTSNIQTQIDNISTDVVSDTSPSLGGDLDVGANALTSSGNIEFQTSGQSTNTHSFIYNEAGGEMHLRNSSGGGGAFFDYGGTFGTRLLNNATTGDIQLGQAAVNTAGKIKFMGAGYVERMTVDSSGNVGINEATPVEKLEVNGIIKAGDGGATSGAIALTGRYDDNHLPWTIGSNYSSAAPQIMYGLKPKTGVGGANKYLSSAGNASWNRGVLKIDNALTFSNAPASTTAVGTEIAVTERFKINHDGTWGKAPAGTVIQTKTVTDSYRRKFTSKAANTFHEDYTNLNMTFTPKSNNSTLMFFVNIKYGVDATSAYSVFWQIREGTTVHTGLNGKTGGSYRCFDQDRADAYNGNVVYKLMTASINGAVLDNTATTARSFNFRYRMQGGSRDMAINRDGADVSDTNQGSHSPSAVSTFTIMEIAK